MSKTSFREMSFVEQFLECSDLLQKLIKDFDSVQDILNLRGVCTKLKKFIDIHQPYAVFYLKNDGFSYKIQWILHRGDSKLAERIYNHTDKKEFFMWKLYHGILEMFQKLHDIDDDKTLSMFGVPILHCLERLLCTTASYWKHMWLLDGFVYSITDYQNSTTYREPKYVGSQIRLREFYIRRLDWLIGKISYRELKNFFFSIQYKKSPMLCNIPAKVFEKFSNYILNVKYKREHKMGMEFTKIAMYCAQSNYDMFLSAWREFEKTKICNFNLCSSMFEFVIPSQSPEIYQFMIHNYYLNAPTQSLSLKKKKKLQMHTAYHIVSIKDPKIRKQCFDLVFENPSLRHYAFVSHFYIDPQSCFDIRSNFAKLIHILTHLEAFTKLLPLCENKLQSLTYKSEYVGILFNCLLILHKTNDANIASRETPQRTLLEKLVMTCCSHLVSEPRNICGHQLELKNISLILVERIFLTKIGCFVDIDNVTKFIFLVFKKLMRFVIRPSTSDILNDDVFRFDIIADCIFSINNKQLFSEEIFDCTGINRDRAFYEAWKNYGRNFQFLLRNYKSSSFRRFVSNKDWSLLSDEQKKLLYGVVNN